jgi:hypothetical protein
MESGETGEPTPSPVCVGDTSSLRISPRRLSDCSGNAADIPAAGCRVPEAGGVARSGICRRDGDLRQYTGQIPSGDCEWK